MINFNSSPEHTIGVELEIQLVDKQTRELSPSTTKIMQGLNSYPFIKNELFESVIEINSVPCRTVADVASDLKEHVRVLYNEAAKHGVKLTMAGTHPISNWARQEISPLKRYQEIVEKIQMPARRMLVYGLHVHVGLKSGNEAIFVKTSLINYIPHLLALSTSSPYWVKRDSGMESYRVKILETLPTTGLPFLLNNWEEFCELVHALQRAGAINSIREIWWDIRPHPGFGTVEVRVCDAMPRLEDVTAIVALVQALVAYLAKQFREGKPAEHLPSFLIRENKWRAARYGLDAKLITNTLGDTVDIKSEIRNLVEKLLPLSRELGSEKYLMQVDNILQRGANSKRQRQIFHETGDLYKVVDDLIEQFEESWGLTKPSEKKQEVGNAN